MKKRVVLSKKEIEEAGSESALLKLLAEKGLDPAQPYKRWPLGEGQFEAFSQ